MLLIALLQEIADAGGPVEWLTIFNPEPNDVPEPCYLGCGCGCEVVFLENQMAVGVATLIREQLDRETLARVEAEIAAQRQRSIEALTAPYAAAKTAA